MSRTWAYLRVSGESQATEDKDGLLRQRLACEAEAARRGWRIARIFEDRGVSGTHELANRPALRDLRFVARRGDVVLVEKADRLARDLAVFCMIRKDLTDLGVQIISADGSRDLGDPTPTEKMITDIMAVIAEYERSVIVGRMTAAKRRKREQGIRVDGPKPYGTHPGEDVAVSMIRELAGQGMTLASIASRLEEMGIRPRRSASWPLTTISKIARRKDAA